MENEEKNSPEDAISQEDLAESAKRFEIFTKGYNDAYLLCKHEPKLAEALFESSKGESYYLGGMKAGKRQYEKDKFIEQIKQTQENAKDKQHEK